MKNPEIELVKKWLDNPESVSAEERERAADAATGAANAAVRFYAVSAARSAHASTYASAYAAAAARSAVNGDVDAAKYWVKEYEELTR